MFFFAQADKETPTSEIYDKFPDIVSSLKGDLATFLPELILCFGVCWVIMVDLFQPRQRSRLLGIHAFVIVAAALVVTLMQGITVETPRTMFSGLVADDGFARFFKCFLFVGTLICIPMVMMHKPLRDRRMGEFYGLLLGSVIGMCLMVCGRNLLTFFLGIEFASITCYLLTAYMKDNRLASEGGLKYVIYGSVASGMMIYGLSLIYGLTGSLDVGTIAQTLQVERSDDLTLMVAGLLALAGFAYKISAFPMHFWCPDVYEGAPLPFTAFLSVISKAAGFAVLIRFLWPFTHGGTWDLAVAGGSTISVDWPLILGVVAAFTMTVGNLAALFQTNMKRLLAYSSIAHAGYLLMGVAALHPLSGSGFGWESVAFYLVVYMFMNFGAFLIVAILSARDGDETIEAFRGLGKRHVGLAISMFLFLVSLIGLPPTGGFAGKFQLLRSAVDNDLIVIAVIAGINTAISVYYYARIIKIMFLEGEGHDEPVRISPAMLGFVFLLLIPVLYLGVAFDPTVAFIRGLELIG